MLASLSICYHKFHKSIIRSSISMNDEMWNFLWQSIIVKCHTAVIYLRISTFTFDFYLNSMPISCYTWAGYNIQDFWNCHWHVSASTIDTKVTQNMVHFQEHLWVASLWRFDINRSCLIIGAWETEDDWCYIMTPKNHPTLCSSLCLIISIFWLYFAATFLLSFTRIQIT